LLAERAASSCVLTYETLIAFARSSRRSFQAISRRHAMSALIRWNGTKMRADFASKRAAP